MSVAKSDWAAKRPRILALGDMLLDVVVTGDVSAAREAGGAVQLYAGGSAANFAVGAARAGAAVRFVGRVGDDLAGRLLVDELERAGVQAQVRVAAGQPTGTVLVWRAGDGAGGSRMLSEPGASATLDPTDLDPAWFAGLAGFHLTGYSFLRPGPASAARQALALARAQSPGVVCSMDPAPAHLMRDMGPDAFRALLAALRFDVLFPNLEEGQVLTGATEPEAVLRGLQPLAPLVVLTLGADGCLVQYDRQAAGGTGEITGPRTSGDPAAVLVQHVPPVLGPVLDTTGAGDALAAGFMVAYLRDRDPLAAAQTGAVAAGSVIGRLGAR